MSTNTTDAPDAGSKRGRKPANKTDFRPDGVDYPFALAEELTDWVAAIHKPLRSDDFVKESEYLFFQQWKYARKAAEYLDQANAAVKIEALGDQAPNAIKMLKLQQQLNKLKESLGSDELDAIAEMLGE